ncbi:MAG: hypothetical protein HY744_08615 [Deltaproteobacteria bacterium]|nr:hypothetical protein [Deltaproteobacteria bacterium]
MSREIWVNVCVSNPTSSRRAFTIRALVDTGSIDSAMPARLRRQSGIRPMGRETYEAVGGGLFRRDWGLVLFEIQGKKRPTAVTYEPATEVPLVGSVTLEELGFDVDMRDGGLRPFVRRKGQHRRRVARRVLRAE